MREVDRMAVLSLVRDDEDGVGDDDVDEDIDCYFVP